MYPLVTSTFDFGHNGRKPAHPELMDWLAADFRDQGGSLKALHRRIVTSETYRQVSVGNGKAAGIDDGNTLLWRQNRRRLEAEALRDAILSTNGKLDLTMGGPGWQDFVIERPEHSPHFRYDLADFENPGTWRRSIYRFIVRSQTQPWMTSMDCADPSMRVDKRNESLSPLQALALLNDTQLLEAARFIGGRMLKEAGSTRAEQVRFAFRILTSRTPTQSSFRLGMRSTPSPDRPLSDSLFAEHTPPAPPAGTPPHAQCSLRSRTHSRDN